MKEKKNTIFQSGLMGPAVAGAILRLDPRLLWSNPVMFVVECVSVVTTVISIDNLISGGPFWFNAQISVWLWFTVLFANFAEALAEGRGKAQAETLRRAQSEAYARKIGEDGRVEKNPCPFPEEGRHRPHRRRGPGARGRGDRRGGSPCGRISGHR